MIGPTRRRARFRARMAPLVAAGVLLGTALAVASTLPAVAHDALAASDPPADAVVAELPEALTLTFTDDVLADPGAAQVQVTDAGGADLVSGALVVAGPTVAAPLDGDPVGAVRVLWRVVSSDGHPISGEFAFTVTPPPSAPVSPTATATATPTGVPSATPTTSPGAVSDDGPGALTTMALAGGGVIVAAAGVAGAVLVGRRRRGRSERSDER